jgi:hypothetical protein
MKRKRRVILDVPSGTIDRGEVRKVFAELREKRLARMRRAAASGAEGAAPETDHRRKHAASATVDATRKQDRAA